jgi:DnaJ-class molecular chaperone
MAKCGSCNGSGTMRCPNCNGSGRWVRDDGDVYRQEICPSCGGNGNVECMKCSGGGEVPPYDRSK